MKANDECSKFNSSEQVFDECYLSFMSDKWVPYEIRHRENFIISLRKVVVFFE